MIIDEVITAVAEYECSHVTVTGGEPLAQPACRELLTDLANAGYEVSLETSGALPVAGLDPRVRRIVDMKTPGSGESTKNLAQNFDVLTPNDEVKFVICDRADYEWAKAALTAQTFGGASVFFSPSHEQPGRSRTRVVDPRRPPQRAIAVTDTQIYVG